MTTARHGRTRPRWEDVFPESLPTVNGDLFVGHAGGDVIG
jgi:hypothetical protein